MRKFILVLALITFVACCPVSLQAQEVNTQGRDFWVSFLPNWPKTTPKMELLVAGQKACSGTATNPLTGWTTSFTVTPGVVTTVVIPNSECLMGKINSVEHKAIHVTTTEDVSLYASNYANWSYDVANILPTNILQSNYIAQSYGAGMKASQGELSSRMLIVAVENNTEITIDPMGGLKGVFPPFSKKEITLNAGECYMCFSAKGDISGTSVHVKNGKKVAVFSGGDTQIPYDGCCYDAVFEQCMPLAYWGRHYVVTATARRKNDLVRITALSPGCRISIDGKHRATLGERKSYDFKLDSKKHEAVYISASSPVLVCVYFTSNTLGGELGDPSMVYINPIEQQMDKVTFGTYNTVSTQYHFVNIVTQTSQVGKMNLDGESIASEFKPVPKKQELSYARVNVQHGSHTLECEDGGFVAHIYGLGNYESYAFSAGSNSRVLNQFDEDGNLIISNDLEDLDDLDKSDDSQGMDKGNTPTYTHTDTLPAVQFDGLTLTELKHNGKVKGVIKDKEGMIVDPGQFEISTDSDMDYLFDSIGVIIENDSVQLTFYTRYRWCDCFVPKRVRVNVILTPIEEGEQASRIVIPITVPITKDAPWITRCFWVMIALGGLLLLFFYLRSLFRKPRFKKSATINAKCFNRYGAELDSGYQQLRQPGFLAWFVRWFLPGAERSTLSFYEPDVKAIRFVASESSEVVEVPKSDIDSHTMTVDSYDPANDSYPKIPVRFAANDSINILDAHGRRAGYLFFSPGSERDGRGYKMFLGILIVLDILTILVLLFLMIRGSF
jgi:hypothetical protein